MKRILVVVGLVISGSLFVLGQMKNNKPGPGGQDEQELRAKLHQWDEAYAGRDIETLASILADDFIFTNASGVVVSRSQYISANIKAPDMTLEIPTDSEEVSVRVYKETAVMTSRGAQRGQPFNRDPAVRYRYTDVWVKQQGRWRAVASQATRIQ